jgi:hypothetical protein
VGGSPRNTLYLRRSVFDRIGVYYTRYRITADCDFVLRCLSQAEVSPSDLPQVLGQDAVRRREQRLARVPNPEKLRGLCGPAPQRRRWCQDAPSQEGIKARPVQGEVTPSVYFVVFDGTFCDYIMSLGKTERQDNLIG